MNLCKFLTTILLCGLLYQTAASQQTKSMKGVTAHRGFSTTYPDNTLVAFQAAIEAGADWVELDIHKTKDGKIVVIHDATTNRTSDKDLIVAQTSYEELQKLDVATGFRKSQGLTLEKCPGQRIPLLEEALKLILKQKDTKLSIQPKADCVAEAMDIVKALNAEHMVGFNDVSLKYMSQVKELAPHIPVFWDRRADTDVTEDIAIAKASGFEALVINYKGITEEKVRLIKAAGLEIGVWTVNDEATLIKMLDIGVERVYTDDPALLIRLHQSRMK